MPIGVHLTKQKLAANELVLAMRVGGMCEDPRFRTWFLKIGVRCRTGGYILSAGRADVKRLRELKLSWRTGAALARGDHAVSLCSCR